MNQLINNLGMVVISEDCINLGETKIQILNQWTYHARLYNAAKYVTKHNNMQVVQLVSFGCGLDAITSDEVRDMRQGTNYILRLKLMR